MITIGLAILLLSQGVTGKARVMELIPLIGEAGLTDAANQGARAGTSVDINLSTFLVLASTASATSVSVDEIQSALAFPFHDRTAGNSVQCDTTRAPGPGACKVPGGVYFELNGLVVSAVTAEATLTEKWVPAAGFVSVRTIRLHFKRVGERWIKLEQITLLQS